MVMLSLEYDAFFDHILVTLLPHTESA